MCMQMQTSSGSGVNWKPLKWAGEIQACRLHNENKDRNYSFTNRRVIVTKQWEMLILGSRWRTLHILVYKLYQTGDQLSFSPVFPSRDISGTIFFNKIGPTLESCSETSPPQSILNWGWTETSVQVSKCTIHYTTTTYLCLFLRITYLCLFLRITYLCLFVRGTWSDILILVYIITVLTTYKHHQQKAQTSRCNVSQVSPGLWLNAIAQGQLNLWLWYNH